MMKNILCVTVLFVRSLLVECRLRHLFTFKTFDIAQFLSTYHQHIGALCGEQLVYTSGIMFDMYIALCFGFSLISFYH